MRRPGSAGRTTSPTAREIPSHPWVYGEIVRKLAPGEVVRVLVNSGRSSTSQPHLKRVGVDLARVTSALPTTAAGRGTLVPSSFGARLGFAIARFHFNAWRSTRTGRRTTRSRARREALQAPTGRREDRARRGSIDVNGRGTLLTTEECLLDPKVQTRNLVCRASSSRPCSRDAGITNTLWLGKGIAGDDTHGHVTICAAL